VTESNSRNAYLLTPLFYVLFIVFGGSVVGYLLSLGLDYSYEKLLSRSVLLLAAIGLLPLWRIYGLSAQSIGLSDWRSTPSLSVRCYTVAILAALPPMLFFNVIGFRVWDDRVVVLSAVFLFQCLIIFCSAWLVSIFEETLFRGVMFTSLRKHFKFFGAASITSVVYAMVHFLVSGELTYADPHWWTGLWVLRDAVGALLSAGGDWDSFLALALLGGIFCWLRETLGLWAAISMHSAFVFALRVYKDLTIRDIVHPYRDLVGDYDNFVGVLVAFWLLFGIVVIRLALRARPDK
jgi:membrane protease YdiL (CAAX protease family)